MTDKITPSTQEESVRHDFSPDTKIRRASQPPGLEYIHALLESAHDVLFRFSITPKPALVYVSQAVQATLGYTVNELLRDPRLIYAAVYPPDQPLFETLLAPKGGDRRQALIRFYRRDGFLVWFEIFLQPIFDASGNPVACEGLARDQTSQMRAQEALSVSQAHLSLIIESAMDAIIVLDANQQIILFNRAAEEMFGVTAPDVLGASIERFIPAQAREIHPTFIDHFGNNPRAMRRMGVTRVTSAVRSDGSEFPIEVSISVSNIQTDRFYTAIVRDITERKHSEEKLIHFSTHDSLTGIHNRAYFEDQIHRMENALPLPLCVILADVDNLKYINDRYGHASGDDVLKVVAQIFTNSFREEDIVARLGGDEFAALLPNSDTTLTAQIVQRIRSHLAEYNRMNPRRPISLSIGLTSVSQGESLSEAIVRADQEMYQEKRSKVNANNRLSEGF
jgi:diguanylate cyclase (GGDEF)-like protein/PAS domain S-box-containing protein